MRHVLLVEDSLPDLTPPEVTFVQYALEHLRTPVRLHIARDGEEALRFVRREREHTDAPWPSVLLLDLDLPRDSGLEVLRELKADPCLRTIPVVVLSTSGEAQDVSRAYHHYASAYIVKPDSRNEMTEVMRRLEHFWFDRAILPTERGSTSPSESPLGAAN
jgi:CheY-like chemotaxis protein